MPSFTPRRLDALAFAALVVAVFVLAVLPLPDLMLRAGFCAQALGAGLWLARRAAGNRSCAE